MLGEAWRTHKAADGNSIGMDLSARCTLYLESVEEVALLGVLGPQVGDTAVVHQPRRRKPAAHAQEKSRLTQPIPLSG